MGAVLAHRQSASLRDVLILVCVEVSVGDSFFLDTDINTSVLILVCVEVSVGDK